MFYAFFLDFLNYVGRSTTTNPLRSRAGRSLELLTNTSPPQIVLFIIPTTVREGVFLSVHTINGWLNILVFGVLEVVFTHGSFAV
jgi:hypothetical protein